jgi:hypothetical protein
MQGGKEASKTAGIEENYNCLLFFNIDFYYTTLHELSSYATLYSAAMYEKILS